MQMIVFFCAMYLLGAKLNRLVKNADKMCNKSEMSLSGQTLQQEMCENKTEHLFCLSLRHRLSFCHQDDTTPFLCRPQRGKKETAFFFICLAVIFTSFDSWTPIGRGLSVNGFPHVTCTVKSYATTLADFKEVIRRQVRGEIVNF